MSDLPSIRKEAGRGYRARVFDPHYSLAFVVGTEDIDHLATLATVYPQNIYFIAQEG